MNFSAVVKPPGPTHQINLVKYIAEVGININKPPQELSTQNKQPIDIKYFSSIVELDEAFKAMHKFSEPNGADAYISKVVADRIISIKNSVIAIKPRKSKKNTDLLDDVVDYFIYRNLKSSDNKKEIYITAKSKFKLKLKDGSTKDLTEYQIRKAVKKYKSII